MNPRYCPTCRRTFEVEGDCPSDGTGLAALPGQFPAPGTDIEQICMLEGPIAAGSMSRIYRAKSAGGAGLAAVKILDPKYAPEPHAVERFYREARIAQLMDHPNVGEVQWYGMTAAGHHAIVMEFLGGEVLSQVVKRHGRLPWKRAVHVAIELCDALGHLHGRRVIHRDLKPDNIQLGGHPGPHEQVKLLDFGIAYVSIDPAFTAPAPGSSGVSGTPAYMSPEQIRGHPLDGRSDLYAMGLLLYEMLSGRRPFLETSPVEICRCHLHTPPPALDGVLDEPEAIPRELRALVQQLLKKRRESRVPGVGDLLQKLMSILPKEEWPARLTARKRRSEGAPKKTRKSLYGIPQHDLLEGRARASVSLLHVQIVLDNASVLAPQQPAKWLQRAISEWCHELAERGHLVQRPGPLAARVLFGVFDSTPTGSKEVVAALEAVSILEKLLAAAAEGDSDVELHSGLVLKLFNTNFTDGSSRLTDADADLAYILACSTEPGGTVLDSHAAQAAKEFGSAEAMPPLKATRYRPSIPIWRFTALA